MPYRAPVSDYQFLLDHVVDFAQVTDTALFADATPDMTQAILSEAAKMAEEVIAPLNRAGDIHPARLENGVVRTSPGFAEGYNAIAEGGWIGMSASADVGGLGLPMTLTNTVNEMIASACLSLQLSPLMTQGQIEALEHHASDAIKALYIPKLISGEWSGTMNLTEPQAGSDVGALRTKAEPNGDGTYAITGQKIYISWADNDFTQNVCHLVLARLPDGVAGTKCISLFMVPKLIPDADGNPGAPNDLRVVSLEHKMGLHGSPTAVMEYAGATGWLVGAPHAGMAAMFTMMNNARLGVGEQGVGVADDAVQVLGQVDVQHLGLDQHLQRLDVDALDRGLHGLVLGLGGLDQKGIGLHHRGDANLAVAHLESRGAAAGLPRAVLLLVVAAEPVRVEIVDRADGGRLEPGGERPALAAHYLQRLGTRQAHHVLGGGLTRSHGLVDVRRHHAERHADLPQQFAAPRRGRREHQFRGFTVVGIDIHETVQLRW